MPGARCTRGLVCKDDRTYARYKTMIDAAEEARKFAEVNKIERMVAAAYPIATQFASIADNVTKQFAAFERFRIQAAPAISEIQRATEIAASRATEISRWLERAASQIDELQLAASTSFEQIRRTIDVIGPSISNFATAVDLVSRPGFLSSFGAGLPTAGTAPVSTSLTITAAALGLRSQELFDTMIADAAAMSASGASGNSLTAEVFTALKTAEATGQADAIAEFLDQFIAKVRSYLANVDSIALLNGILPVIALVIMLITLRVQMESATTADVENLGTTVQQAAVGHDARLDQNNELIRTKLDELIRITRDGATARIITLPDQPVYQARRLVTVRTDKGTKASSVGTLRVGEIASVITFAKKWIEIEYFDHLLGRKNTGWVAKKYLERIH
jgi:hypothetical protein